MISLSGLNSMQRQAAEKVEGPLLILAGAGTGKTRTITYRMAHMIDNLHIPPENILALSFTNKAAKEMRERVYTLIGKRKAKKCSLLTFHSLGLRILKKEIVHLNYHKNFTIYDPSDQMTIIREGLKHYHDEKKFDGKMILSLIGKLKNQNISEDDYADSQLFNDEDPYHHATQYLYSYYQEKLKFYNAIDFDDILLLTHKLFSNFPEIKNKYSELFKFIMVDEYQDTNPLQFEIIKQLTSLHNNICVVGDDDQAIYSFRGADIKNILSFEETFPNAHIVKLEENYRSNKPILNLANKVIALNKKRREKTLWSDKDSSNSPLLWAMADPDHEAQVVIDDITQHQKAGKHLGDIAILYRSNTQAPILENELRMSQVPYTIIGGKKLYEKKEIKDLMAYLFVISNPFDELSLRRILNVPSRGIGIVTLNEFLEISKNKNCSLFQAFQKHSSDLPVKKEKIDQFVRLIEKYQQFFKTHSLKEALESLLDEIQFYEYIEKQYDSAKKRELKKNDVQFFIDSAERFSKYRAQENALKDFIERLLLQDSQDNSSEEDDDDVRKNQVTLMTLHSSKGLEFPKVYLIGAEESLIPHSKTVKLGEDVSEERRLFYVGITRAEEKLIMSYCKERSFHGKKLTCHPTRFLNDLMQDDILHHQDRTTFGHLSQDEAEEYKKNFFEDLYQSLDD